MLVPPLKSQGIKTKLSPWIHSLAADVFYKRWVEPFMGTGAVAFNIQPMQALLCDSNPHIINFYKNIQSGAITPPVVRDFLTHEGELLLKSQGEYYYEVRQRFNKKSDCLDFLFLSRSCFNGMMRFNRQGGFNVPFCRKPNRFMKALVTKITNQVNEVFKLLSCRDYEFKCQDFTKTLLESKHDDIVYCDPPYIGRHVDYFDSWSEKDENHLKELLISFNHKFLVSTWLKNKYRRNEYVYSTWRDCHISTYEHFYHIGGKEKNRNAVTEALLTNFPVSNALSSQKVIKAYKAENGIAELSQSLFSL